jgi:hypothetical protein
VGRLQSQSGRFASFGNQTTIPSLLAWLVNLSLFATAVTCVGIVYTLAATRFAPEDKNIIVASRKSE